MDVYFATGNPNKISEIQSALPDWVSLKSIKELGITEDIPENTPTISQNSIEKAQYVWDRYKVPCIADDTGLEVNALGGAPGVYSARFAGPQKDSEANIDFLLEKLKVKKDRSARFLTVLSYINEQGETHTFEGIVTGTILEKRSGNGGFGYDPVFQPEGKSITFAEMSMEEKNKISHRGRAIRKFIDFIKSSKK